MPTKPELGGEFFLQTGPGRRAEEHKPVWVTCPGAALTQAERTFLLTAARALGDTAAIVNIGVMWGASMHCLRAGAPTALLIGVDIDYKTHPLMYESELASGPYILIEGDSGKVHEQVHGTIDLLFIDGSHVYTAVREDIRWWTPKVARGGLIILHDYKPAEVDLKRDPSLVGVRRAVDEWVLSRGADIQRAAEVDSIIAFEVLA